MDYRNPPPPENTPKPVPPPAPPPKRGGRTIEISLSRDGIWLNGRPATAQEAIAALQRCL